MCILQEAVFLSEVWLKYTIIFDIVRTLFCTFILCKITLGVVGCLYCTNLEQTFIAP